MLPGEAADSPGVTVMQLYADEDFPLPAVTELRGLGHDILTAQEDGRTQTPDLVMLARAHALGRAILTHNRRHYERLHRGRGNNRPHNPLIPVSFQHLCNIANALGLDCDIEKVMSQFQIVPGQLVSSL